MARQDETRADHRRPSAILFDMDGTLTVPNIDFDQIRADMNIGPGPILEAMLRMNATQLAHAEQVLHRHERKAAIESQLNPGCQSLLDCIHRFGLPVALITRNSLENVEIVQARHGLRFEVILTRADEPHKPDAYPVVEACRRLGVLPQSSWMVGDSHHDIESGNAAGATTVWVSHRLPRDFQAEPDHEVPDLSTLQQLIVSMMRR